MCFLGFGPSNWLLKLDPTVTEVQSSLNSLVLGTGERAGKGPNVALQLVQAMGLTKWVTDEDVGQNTRVLTEHGCN